MRFQMGRVDHRRTRRVALGSQGGEDPIENADLAPPYEAVVKGLVGTVPLRCVTPHQSMANGTDNAADDTPVINPRHPPWFVRQ